MGLKPIGSRDRNREEEQGAEKRKQGAEKRKQGAEKRKQGAEKRKQGAEKGKCTLGPPYVPLIDFLFIQKHHDLLCL